jgi:hypothetical protein
MTLVWRPGFSGLTDADAITYVAAVEAADGQALEFGVGKAINDFVVGCKLDGTWNAIKASCILAGARTLNGALVPLVKQPADSNPAQFGTAGGWNYNRKTGLQGNGTDNYLSSGRNNNVDPQNSSHCAVYCSVLQSTSSGQYPVFMGAGSNGTNGSNVLGRFQNNGGLYHLNRSNSIGNTASLIAGFMGTTRSGSSDYLVRASLSTTSYTAGSQAPLSGNTFIFATNNSGAAGYAASRLAFYSIGESLDLALLDTRVSALITAIGAAIP